VTYRPTDPEVSAEQWFAAVRDQSLKLDDALVDAGRDQGDVRSIAQFVRDARWPFESDQRYRDTVGWLAGYGFDEITTGPALIPQWQSVIECREAGIAIEAVPVLHRPWAGEAD
jgi:hypothetical protein